MNGIQLTPILLIAATLAGLAPATIDAWLAKWLGTKPYLLAVLTMVVGAVFGALSGALNQVASTGGTLAVFEGLVLVGTGAGLLTGFINLAKSGALLPQTPVAPPATPPVAPGGTPPAGPSTN